MSELNRPLAVTAPASLAVTAGEPALLSVEVANQLDEAVVATVRAVGAEAGASQVVQLPPGARATVELTVTVAAGFPGQEQSAGVEALARRASDPYGAVLGRALAPVRLVLDEGADLHARLQPAEVRGARRAGFAVELENRGTAPVEVRLRDDRAGRAAVAFDPHTVTVPAGGRTRVPATVRRPRSLIGTSRRTSFGVVVSTRRRDQRLPGGFIQTPVLSRGLAGLVAILAVIAVWASALAVGLDRVGPDDDRQVARAASDETPAGDDGGEATDGGGTSGTDAGSGGDSGSTGDDAGEGADEPAATEEEPRVRVGGTITAADRGGVTVTIEPVSLADAVSSGADFQTRPGFRIAQGPAKAFGRSVAMAAQRVDARRVTTTDVDGGWAFGGVRAPGLYLLTFAKAGYETQKAIVETAEGEQPPDLDIRLEAGAGTITGRVVTDDGAGLGGVEITATDGTVALTTTTVSEGDVGAFSLEGLATPGSWSLTTSRAGYGAETVRVDLAGSGRSDGVVITVRTGVAAISGTVISAEGPVGGLTVEVTDGELTRTATTLTEGATGTFLVPGLPIPGVYTVTVQGEGWQTLTQQVDLRADAQISLEMRRSTAQLVGSITDADTGAGLGGVGITLVSDGQTFKSSSAGAADDGGFELRGIPPGSYVVTFELYGYATEQVLVALSAGDRKPIDVAMTPVPPESLPDESTIQGRVTATTGAVIAAADVEVDLTVAVAGPDGEVELTTRTVTTQTDADGNYALTGLPPGIHRVRVSKTGFAPASRSARVGVGAAVTIDFALVPNAKVTGRVISAFDNLPRAGAVVQVRRAGTTEWLHEATTVLGEPGEPPRYAFEGATSLPSGTYELQVTSLDDHRPSAVTTVEVAAPQDVVLDLRVDRLGHLRVRVVEPDLGQLQPLSGAALTVRDASGADLCSQIIPVTPGRACPVTTTGEVIELAGLEPGPVVATAELADYTDGTSGTVQVELNRVSDAVVALSPKPGTITGTARWMRDGTWAGVPNPTVWMTFISAYDQVTFEFHQSRCRVTGGPNGNFAFDFTSETLECEPVGFANGFPSTVWDFGQPIFGYGTVEISASGFEPISTERQLFGPVLVRLQPLDGTIVGTVSLNDGPVPVGSLTGITAEVLRRPAEGSGALQVTVDADGQISATEGGALGVTPGPYEIRFSKAGYDSATVEVCVGPGDTTCTDRTDPPSHDASVTLDRHGSVTVSAVSRPDPGAPANPGNNPQLALNGVTFVLTPKAGGQARTLVAASTQSSVTFEGVSAGAYEVTATRASYGAPTSSLDVTVSVGVHSANNQVVFQRFGSISGRLVGRIGPSDTPIANATITAKGPGNAETTFSAVTNDKGEFRIESALPDNKLTDGTYVLTTSGLGDRGWVDLNRSGVQVSNAADRALGDVVLEPTPASLSGTVVDEAGEPMTGARVRLYRTAATLISHEVTTGASGTFAFTDVTPALWSLEVTKAGYGPQRVDVDLVSSRVVTGYEVELALLQNTVLGTVEGRFGTTDVDLEGATVTVTEVETLTVAGTATTDEDGEYRVDGLRNGSYAVTIAKAGFTTSAATTVDLLGGSSRRVDATLAVKRRTVTVTVTSAVGDAPVVGASVALLAAADDPTAVGAGETSTDEDGVATFTDVLPGSYVAEVGATDGHQGGSTTITVPISDATAPLAAAVEIQEALLTGTVSFDDGSGDDPGPGPVEGAVVVVYEGADADLSEAEVVWQLTTDEDGAYSAFVAPGGYTIEARYQGAVHVGSVTVAAGETKGTSPTLEALGTIEVTVTLDDDEVQGAIVSIVRGEEQPRSPTSSIGGVYTFESVAPGTYAVNAITADGGHAGSGSVVVGPGADATVAVPLTAVPPPDGGSGPP